MRSEDLTRTLRIASDAQRNQAFVDAVMTPEVRRIIDEYGKRFAEMITVQLKVDDIVPPALRQQVLEQNKRIAEMVDTSGLRKVIANIDFKLPDDLAEQVVVYREGLEAQASEATDADDGEIAGLGRLMQEREAIITSIQRIGYGVEGFAYLPGSHVPHFVGFLILLLAVLGEVANEKLNEREDE